MQRKHIFGNIANLESSSLNFCYNALKKLVTLHSLFRQHHIFQINTSFI